MSLKSKIIDEIEARIKVVGNYQNNITKNSSKNNSGVNIGWIDSFNPKTGKARFKDSASGQIIEDIIPTGSSVGVGLPGILLGMKQFMS